MPTNPIHSPITLPLPQNPASLVVSLHKHTLNQVDTCLAQPTCENLKTPRNGDKPPTHASPDCNADNPNAAVNPHHPELCAPNDATRHHFLGACSAMQKPFVVMLGNPATSASITLSTEKLAGNNLNHLAAVSKENEYAPVRQLPQ